MSEHGTPSTDTAGKDPIKNGILTYGSLAITLAIILIWILPLVVAWLDNKTYVPLTDEFQTVLIYEDHGPESTLMWEPMEPADLKKKWIELSTDPSDPSKTWVATKHQYVDDLMPIYARVKPEYYEEVKNPVLMYWYHEN